MGLGKGQLYLRCVPQLHVRLQVHPELRRGVKHLGQLEGRVGRHAS